MRSEAGRQTLRQTQSGAGERETVRHTEITGFQHVVNHDIYAREKTETKRVQKETHTLRQTNRRTDRPEEMGRPKQAQIKTESETKRDRDKERMDRRRQTAIRDGHNLSIQNLKLAPESGIFRSAHSLTSWHSH